MILYNEEMLFDLDKTFLHLAWLFRKFDLDVDLILDGCTDASSVLHLPSANVHDTAYSYNYIGSIDVMQLDLYYMQFLIIIKPLIEETSVSIILRKKI